MDKDESPEEKEQAAQAWLAHPLTREFRQFLEQRRNDYVDRVMEGPGGDGEKLRGAAAELKELIVMLTTDAEIVAQAYAEPDVRDPAERVRGANG